MDGDEDAEGEGVSLKVEDGDEVVHLVDVVEDEDEVVHLVDVVEDEDEVVHLVDVEDELEQLSSHPLGQ